MNPVLKVIYCWIKLSSNSLDNLFKFHYICKFSMKMFVWNKFIFDIKDKGWSPNDMWLLSIDLSSGQEDDFEDGNSSNRKEDGEDLEALGAILSKQTKHVVNNSVYYEFQVPEKLTTKPNHLNDVQKPKEKVIVFL